MNNNLLQEGRFIDAAVVYMLAKKFILPFPKWKAFRLGLIDKKGKRTGKPIRTTEEKNAYTLLDNLIRKIRRLIGDRWFIKMSLAYLLLRESKEYFPKDISLLTEDTNGIRKELKLGSNESIVITYKDNINEFDFFILSKIGDNISSQFGAENISKRHNEDFLLHLDNALSNILNGGFSEFIVYTAKGDETKVSISYSESEIKIESEVMSDDSISLGKFYTVLPDKELSVAFVDFWADFMAAV